jgi:hypothetical protein
MVMLVFLFSSSGPRLKFENHEKELELFPSAPHEGAVLKNI